MASVSAADLERFCYCPLSWHLGRQTEVRSEALERGSGRHSELGAELDGIVQGERKAGRLERFAVWTAILATAMALLGAMLLSTFDPVLMGQLMSIMALMWLLMASIILYRSASAPNPVLAGRREWWIALFAALGMATAFNAVPVLDVRQEQALAYQAVSVIILLLSCLCLYASNHMAEKVRRSRERTGVSAEIAYVGEGTGQGEVLHSSTLGLSGRPDYVMEVEGGFVPVEVKTGRTPRGPLFSHILQLAAYCQLVEEAHGPVPYGIIRYDKREDVIVFDDRLRALLRSKLDEVQEHMDGAAVHRSHDRPGKCRSCSRRELCPERLE